MFGFGKKSTAELSAVASQVYTIPMEFYGGVNPVVKFKKVETEVEVDGADRVLSGAEKSLFHSATAAGGGRRFHPANFFASQKFLFASIGVLFVLFAASAGIYYFWQWRASRPVVIPPPPAVTYEPPVAPPEIIPPPAEIIVPTTTEVAPPPLPPTEASLDFPSMLLGDSADLDKDGIADLAEEIFQTDPSVPDTDNDSYADFTEVYNLYNPAGFAPVKIIDSGLVKEYASPAFGYQIYYPAGWALGTVDTAGRDVLFSTLTGENIEVRVFDLSPGQSFPEWFTQWAPREKFSDLTPFENAFKERGVRRNDNLVFYFADSGHVFAILYHTTDSNTVNYRSVMTMLARSFRLAGNTVPLVLPALSENNPLLESASTTEVFPEVNASSTL